MSNFDEIIILIEELLGKGKVTKKGEVLFFCPVCNHRKRKLSVNINSGRWHCWVCEGSLNVKGKTLNALFTKFEASRQQFLELGEICDDIVYIPKTETQKILTLPTNFISLRDESPSMFYRQAYNYITKNRRLSIDDINKYNIGYCEDGKYQNRVILPSYDKNGKLNYFTARSFLPKDWMPYLNPSFSKDMIGFEFFINWSLPVILTEGWFDAAAIKRNVIPLFGKTIQEKIKVAIVENNVQTIYIALDGDAFKNALKVAKYFMDQHRDVYLIELKDEDPADLGLERFFNLLHQTKKMDFGDLIKFKIG